MTREELGLEILKVSHISGEFKLRSGIISNEYFDKYQFECRPNLLNEITNYLIGLLPTEFDLLAGLETGGIPLATALALKIGKPMVLVRKKAKDYGTMKLAEGPDIEQMKLVVIEDVVTSGGQILTSIENIRKIGGFCNVALCVIDREQGGSEILSTVGIELRSLFKMSELKQLAQTSF